MPVVAFGGALSYAFYLWHADVVGWMAGLHAHAAVAAVVAFLITAMIAGVSWLLVEKPAILLGRSRGLPSRIGRSPAPAAGIAGGEPGQA